MKTVHNWLILGMVALICASCAEVDILVPKGEKGERGESGLSAYELWIDQVTSGMINWPSEKTAITDFFQYLTGKEGKSAYDLWKESIKTDNVDDPHNPGSKWDPERDKMNDFWWFLTGASGKDGQTPHIGDNGNWYIGNEDTGIPARGKDGKDGTDGATGNDGISPEVSIGEDGNWYINGEDSGKPAFGKDGSSGKSAYELWKEMIADGSVDDPHNPDLKWDPKKDSLQDFWEFLRGNGDTGENDTNGQPGELGKPGEEVIVINGIPNVIAQYTQPEYGEYVRVSDGGVMYKVYDEKGEVAPNAKVKGMPGIDPEKEYVSGPDGTFIVPKEDLPEIQEMESRWGRCKEVTIQGKEPKISAKNTYVPNRMRVRMIYERAALYRNEQNVRFKLQRRSNPEDDWKEFPHYINIYRNVSLSAYFVSDKNDPNSIISKSEPISTGTDISRFSIQRPIMKCSAVTIPSQFQIWDGTDKYFTIVGEKLPYGETYKWNGTCSWVPVQIAPVVKMLKLKGLSKTTEPFFTTVEGEFDFSHIDFSKLYKKLVYSIKENGVENLEPLLYTEEEARKQKVIHVYFNYYTNSNQSQAIASTSSASEPTFSAHGVFLNSEMNISDPSYTYYTGYTGVYGYIVRGETEGSFIFKKSSAIKVETQVTYEE